MSPQHNRLLREVVHYYLVGVEDMKIQLHKIHIYCHPIFSTN